MKRPTVEPIIHATDSAYIDPVNCSSTVSYKVTTDGYGNFSGHVELADCNRKIEWYFGAEKYSVAKIDKAIAMLKEFRTQYAAERARVEKRRAVTPK